MFESFGTPPADSILALAVAFRNDPRAGKIDLGIGVYKNDEGATPVMRSVKAAEKLVWEREPTKAYLGLGGDEAFCAAMVELVLGKSVPPERVRAAQTVGGGAAVRLLCETMAADGRKGTLWVPDPTWINHVPIATAVGLEVRSYAYLDRQSSEVAFGRMAEDLKGARPGDAVLLHGCCHNPSGADLTEAQWQAVARLVAEKGLLPFVDIAYQGFGDGMEEDACGLRHLAAAVPEMLVAASCSKNFGVYRDRVGAAMLVARNAAEADRAKAVLLAKGRVNYSFPPHHGAATVAAILSDGALRDDWRKELEAMRRRMVANRERLADALARATGSGRFEFLRRHKGMFSLLGLSEAQIARLREEFAVFMPPDGRMNLAALRAGDVEAVSGAIAAAL